jgi:Zn-dependent peptidase ImmA (M78 family)
MSHDYCVPARTRLQLEQSASAWRQALGVRSDCMAPDLVAILEHEIASLFPDFCLCIRDDLSMRGAEGYTEFDPPRIVLSDSTYLSAANFEGRGRWTAAHELGHLVLHKSAVPLDRAPTRYTRMDSLPSYASAEWQANAFAAGFLMPASSMRGYDDPHEVAEFFKVSLTAAQNRMSTLGSKRTRVMNAEVTATIQQWRNSKSAV